VLPLLVSVRSIHAKDPRPPRRFAFDQSPVSIGRSPFADLQLTEPFVSRWEGTLRFDERELTYFPLGTTNPTMLDGHPLDERDQDVPILAGSVLTIGELELRFAREPVPDADVRRKDKLRPAQDAREHADKTLYLDKVAPLRGVPEKAPPLRGVPLPPPPSWLAAKLAGAVPAAPSVERVPADVGADAEDELAKRYRGYRAAWTELLREFDRSLTAAPEAERAELAGRLQRRCPRAAAEPDFRALLRRLQLPVMRTEVPEVREWLLALGKGVLPPQLQLDSGLTLERILRLLELLAQSLAEVHAAQDSVRSRWLGHTLRRSVLRSENGRAALTYLLNPQANWDERTAELQQTVREAVTHELALFKATHAAARRLLEALSPEAIEQAEQRAPQATATGGAALWRKLRGLDRPEARLWWRLHLVHGSLLDGERYQRFFLGRMFAHGYLAAMGREPERASSAGTQPPVRARPASARPASAQPPALLQRSAHA
jgi:hypothetical protein